MRTLDELFEAASKSSWLDMNAHVWTLRDIAAECDDVTEFGVRAGISTAALMKGKPKKLTSYDIEPFEHVVEYTAIAEANGIEFAFKRQDDCKELIAATDFLFIDTDHVESQLRRELDMHAKQVRKFLGFHDMFMELWPPAHPRTSYSLWMPVNDLIDSGEWFVTLCEMYSSGLVVLERVK